MNNETVLANENELEQEDQHLFEDQVELWKEKYGKIYKTVLDEHEFIWRKIKRREYSAIMTDKEMLEKEDRKFLREDKIVEIVTLHPDMSTVKKIIEDNGGIATVLSDEIIFKSGFSMVVTTEL